MNNETNEQQLVREIVDEIVTMSTQRNRKKFKESLDILVGSMSWDGFWTFHITEDTKISRIKILSLYEMYGNEFDMHTSTYMLTFPAQKRSLRDIKTVQDERLHHNDELELIPIPPVDVALMPFTQLINDAAIKKATAHLPKPVEKPMICNVILEIQPPEFMSDIRKIMITLIEYSIKLMSMKPNAKYIFDIIRRKLMSENFYIDDALINKYRQTGATPKRIRFAINTSYNDSFSVHEWLEEIKSISSDELGIPDTFHVDESVNMQTEMNDLLKLFRQYLRASFRLCPKAMENLLEMGFDLEQIQKALRYTGNNTSESVEYLIGNTDSGNDGAKQGLDYGMSVTSDMYKEIMLQQEIVTPLCNPSVLYAILSVMDANSFLISSVRFPSIMNLLNKILTTYYVKKCDMVMSQMVGKMPND